MILTIGAMFALAWLVERIVLRNLVNQEEIILFMATIGLNYFLIGFGEYVFGGEPKPMIASELGLPTGSTTFEPFGGIVIIEHLDVAAVIMAIILVTALAIFFNKTRIGRALRAVADDHQAALSVGISLNQIWVIVWFAAGIVALATGIMWGAKSDVSFALQIVALKALPVLIIGGFTSIPGRHHRRSGDRFRREAVRDLLGRPSGQRRRGLVCLRDCADLPAVPATRAVRRKDHRTDLGRGWVQENVLS